MLTELDIINEMLASTGTAPLTTNSDQHPYYKKADKKLKKVNRDLQLKGWWFNQAVRTFMQNTSGEIILPSNALHVDAYDKTSTRYVMRGNRMYDLSNGTFVIGKELKCVFIELVAVPDLPPEAASYVQARAVFEYYRDNDGNALKLNSYKEDRNDAWVMFKAAELKNADVNVFRGTSWARMTRTYGSRASRLIQDD